ncbi:tyrosyl-tRNA synthetase [Candidatus Termititenax dinenymphae]|uniref:Tyrosine--tRNA ligase n=1 Tax=Candidatus Termititenax dinenymphae TaxID=2218523 RepID=A0A388TL67_9BACT|nr:tyrosyl-tRNA synthetase [Candidatus Termititenax dinenymphae]
MTPFETIKNGTLEIISEPDLRQKLDSGKKLKIKFGADPSAPDLHLGHTVVLRKLREFQDLGHEVIFLIGDFTAGIGDPTGKSETRKPLSREQIEQNASTYQNQVFKILDKSKTQVVYNSQWINKLTPVDFIKLMSQITVAQTLEREDFKKRYTEGRSISMHEFMYPLLQGYDSVAIQADVELGGTDQKFNMLVGRDLQASAGQEPQNIVIMPILEGLDGINKMSKSLGNHVGITEPPNEMFGKLMSLPDELMPRYYQLLTDLTFDKNEHPREAKEKLAKFVITQYHSAKDAESAAENFKNVFANNGIPDNIETLGAVPFLDLPLAKLLVAAKLSASNGEAKRDIQSGAVKVNGQKVSDPQFLLITEKTDKAEFIIQVGKRKFVKLN